MATACLGGSIVLARFFPWTLMRQLAFWYWGSILMWVELSVLACVAISAVTMVGPFFYSHKRISWVTFVAATITCIYLFALRPALGLSWEYDVFDAPVALLMVQLAAVGFMVLLRSLGFELRRGWRGNTEVAIEEPQRRKSPVD